MNGFGVDVISYGSKVAPSGIVETADGITLDVTGMAEAAAGAEQIRAGSTTTIQVPTLSSMIGLKVIAWNYRGATTQKDARDLGPLLRATYHGPNSEVVWEVSEAGERWDYDDVLVGPYLAGQELRAKWRPESIERLTDILDDSGIATLATQISRHERTPSGQLVEQITALRAGITGG